MNADTFFKIMLDNQADIKEIVDKLGGIDGVLEIMPDVFRIWKTAVSEAAAYNAAGGTVAAKARLEALHFKSLDMKM